MSLKLRPADAQKNQVIITVEATAVQ